MFIFQVFLDSSAIELERNIDEHGEKAAYLYFDRKRLITYAGWGKSKRGRQ